MSRAEFSKATKQAALERCGGHCEGGMHAKPFRIRKAEYDHFPVPAAIGGSNDLSNCRVLDKTCHRVITSEKDVPAIAKSNRIYEKRMGLRAPKRPFPKRANPWGRREA